MQILNFSLLLALFIISSPVAACPNSSEPLNESASKEQLRYDLRQEDDEDDIEHNIRRPKRQDRTP